MGNSKSHLKSDWRFVAHVKFFVLLSYSTAYQTLHHTQPMPLVTSEGNQAVSHFCRRHLSRSPATKHTFQLHSNTCALRFRAFQLQHKHKWSDVTATYSTTRRHFAERRAPQVRFLFELIARVLGIESFCFFSPSSSLQRELVHMSRLRRRGKLLGLHPLFCPLVAPLGPDCL